MITGSSATGVELIVAERRRQIDVEGYTSEYDSRHTPQRIVDGGGFSRRVETNGGAGCGTKALSRSLAMAEHVVKDSGRVSTKGREHE